MNKGQFAELEELSEDCKALDHPADLKADGAARHAAENCVHSGTMNCCAGCGKPPVGPDDLTVEYVPFRGRKSYCPACHWRLLQRLYVGLYAGWIIFGLAALGHSVYTGQNPLQNTGVWLAALMLGQLLLIVPHELGHALVAKWLGYENIRVLVGSGKPLFNFRFLGALWLFHRVPFGGFTLASPPAEAARWKEMLFIAGGCAVNGAIILLTLPFIGEGGLFGSMRTIPGLILCSNVIVLLENLWPHTALTAYGSAQSDGLLLWRWIFGPAIPRASEDLQVPFWQVVLARLLKGLVVVVLGLGCLSLIFLTSFPFTSDYGPTGLGKKLVLAVLFLSFGMFVGYVTWRVAREPVALRRKSQPLSIPERANQELFEHSRWAVNAVEVQAVDGRLGLQDFDGAQRLIEKALARYPNDVLLLAYQAHIALAGEPNWQLSENLYDQAMRLNPNLGSLGFSHLMLAKLQCVMEQKLFDRAWELSQGFVHGNASVEAKLYVLDGLACQCLYRAEAVFLEGAERWSRQALELAPGELTLKGTLGGVLVELKRDVEAEPLLRACLNGSPAFYDKGIAAFYLGILCTRRKQHEEAKVFFTQAMALHPLPWLVERARQLMELN